jgi:hypothetical protein
MKSPDIYVCECYSTEHQLVFYFDSDESLGLPVNQVYVHVHLNRKPLWKRLIHAFKYILGYRSRFGAFDEFIFNPKDADRLQQVVNYLKSESDNDEQK